MADENKVPVTPPNVKGGKFQLSKEQYDELMEKYDGLPRRVIGVPHIGVVVMVPAELGSQRRFMKKTMGDSKTVERTQRFEAFGELARMSVVWPNVDELDAEINLKRQYMAWVDLGRQAAELAGINTDELEGN